MEPSKEVPAPINKKIYQNLIYFNLFKAHFEPIFSHKRHKTFNLFSDGSRNFLLRPLIGIITKVDSPHANIPMVRQWMENMGCERIFMVNNKTREGISELMDYLQNDLPKLTLEQAKFKQSIGLNE